METLTISKSKVKKSKLLLSNDHRVTFLKTGIKHPKAGWGHCKSCSCRGFIEKSHSNMICQNCGHHYSQHE